MPEQTVKQTLGRSAIEKSRLPRSDIVMQSQPMEFQTL